MIDRRMGIGSAARYAGAGALVLFLCWQHVQATRLGYRGEAARREAAERRGRVAAVRLELEQKLSPAQVSARAQHLGMVPVSPDALRRLPEAGGAAPTQPFARLWSRGTAPSRG